MFINTEVHKTPLELHCAALGVKVTGFIIAVHTALKMKTDCWHLVAGSVPRSSCD